MTTIELTSVQSIFNFAIPLSEGGPDSLSANTSLLGLHKYDTHAVQVEDVRSRETGFSLDEQGFEFHKAPTSFQDFADDDAIRSAYYREVEQLAKRITGANRAHAVGHIKRTTPGAGRTTAESAGPGPVGIVHIDYSWRGAWQRFDLKENRMGVEIPDWEQLKHSRWAALSVWRPLRTVTRDCLAVGDKRTIPDTQLHELEIQHLNGARHGIWQASFDPAQKFYYKSLMEPEDVVVIKLFDTKEDGRARGSPHTGFKTDSDSGLPRYSIETRVLVFFEHESAV